MRKNYKTHHPLVSVLKTLTWQKTMTLAKHSHWRLQVSCYYRKDNLLEQACLPRVYLINSVCVSTAKISNRCACKV